MRVGCEMEHRYVRKDNFIQGCHSRLENSEQRRNRLEKQIGRRIGPLSERTRQHEEHFGPGRVQSLEGVERRPQLVRHEVGGRLGTLAKEMTLTALGPAKDR